MTSATLIVVERTEAAAQGKPDFALKSAAESFDHVTQYPG